MNGELKMNDKLQYKSGMLHMEISSLEKKGNFIYLEVDFVYNGEEGEYLVDINLNNQQETLITKKTYDFDLDEHGEVVGYYLDGNITYREIELITEIILGMYPTIPLDGGNYDKSVVDYVSHEYTLVLEGLRRLEELEKKVKEYENIIKTLGAMAMGVYGEED